MDLSALPAEVRVGTSSFSHDDWRGSFYPAGLARGDYLEVYARTFGTVEIDATWYALPARKTVEAWARRVPEGFLFSLKVPRAITHEQGLVDCREPWRAFLERLEPLGARRGPLLLQFPYVAKGQDAAEYATGVEFRRRLAAFLPLVPDDVQAVVEVRNAHWLALPLLDLLRAHRVALALTAYTTMPGPERLLAGPDPLTAGIGYLRFLGDHRRMDRLVAEARAAGTRAGDWSALIVDREAETRAWVDLVRELLRRQVNVLAYFNNHYAGHAPGSVELFARVWGEGAGSFRGC